MILRIADNNWYDISNSTHLPMSGRECIKEIQEVRNNWAHCSGILPSKDVITHDIEVMIKFWGQTGAPQTNIASLEAFKENVENENIADISYRENADNGVNIEKLVDHAEIKEKDTVYLTGDPKTKGMVFSIQNVGNTVKYEVFVNGEIKPFYAGQIALVEEKISYDKEKKNYMNAMYISEVNAQKCFCQMCGNRFLEKYIERNGVQKNPQYGWKQMYLSLCLECSKDYTLLRNNDIVWEHFINSICTADIEDKETIEIPIGNKELTFTAVHLAEIQTVLELENEDN